MSDSKHITILGGGPAGLAVAYYAAKKGMPFTLYEAKDIVGGNAVTYEHDGFRWDSGAHRFHDKFPEITAEVKALLGDELKEVSAPSHIYLGGRFLKFPLEPLDIIKVLGFSKVVKAGFEILFGKKLAAATDLKSYALSNYGQTLSKPLLLDYSEKLWGVPAEQLSAEVAGSRLEGLKLGSLILEKFFGKKSRHIEGRFYYPKRGIGQLINTLADKAVSSNIRLNAPITGIFHEGGRISAIEIANGEWVQPETVVNTLPLNLFIKLLKPAAPREIIEAAQKVGFRHLLLVTFFIDRKSVSPSASLYFPKEALFTRLTEPKNRSRFMSPKDKTSLVAEIPCFEGDEVWRLSDKELIEKAKIDLLSTGLVNANEISGAVVKRVPFAYPVITLEAMEHIRELNSYLSGFTNLLLTGRNARFSYTHIHDMMRWGEELMEGLSRPPAR